MPEVGGPVSLGLFAEGIVGNGQFGEIGDDVEVVCDEAQLTADLSSGLWGDTFLVDGVAEVDYGVPGE